tara:strand:- start:1420 stop:1767 length:348 start_codon:yes stop_codon:yes gene_type:complete
VGDEKKVVVCIIVVAVVAVVVVAAAVAAAAAAVGDVDDVDDAVAVADFVAVAVVVLPLIAFELVDLTDVVVGFVVGFVALPSCVAGDEAVVVAVVGGQVIQSTFDRQLLLVNYLV